MNLLQADGVGKQTLGQWLVSPISFEVQTGCRLGIVGETGAGKSTLLKMLAGLVQPDSGRVFYRNKPVPGPLYKLIPGHAKMAYLSQHYELRNNYVVADYLDYGNALTEAETTEIFTLCEIVPLLKRKTNSGLSGGEKQRIALAKILLTKPKLLLLDEPFSNLDAPHKAAIKAILRQLQTQLGVDCILVSHDAQDLLPWAQRLLVLQNGHLVQDADPATIFFKPKNAYVAGLLGSFNAIAPSGHPQHTASTGSWMLRPSQIRLSPSGLTATVSDVQFFGTHDLVTAIADGNPYLIQTLPSACKIGQSVGLVFPEGENWYI